MSKTTIGLLIIFAGLAYGSLALERVYAAVVGYLVSNHWIEPPVPEQVNPALLGSRGQIALTALVIVAVGAYVLWNSQL